MCGLLALTAATACMSPDPEKEGELGRAEFSWDRGALGCLFGCGGAGEALATGAHADLRVIADAPLPPLDLSTHEPAVVTCSTSDASDDQLLVRCEGHAPGDSALELRDGAELFERFGLRVRDVARIDVRDEDLYRERLTIMAEGEVTVGFELFDAQDDPLVGVGSIEYTLDGELSERNVTLGGIIGDAVGGFLVGSSDESFTIETLEPGAGRFVLDAVGGAHYELPVAIVDETVIARVELEPYPGTLEDGLNVGSSTSIDVLGFTSSDEPVHGITAECTSSGAVEVDRTTPGHVWIDAVASGTSTITCTANGHSDSVDIEGVIP
jgi:hypothetical protein